MSEKRQIYAFGRENGSEGTVVVMTCKVVIMTILLWSHNDL